MNEELDSQLSAMFDDELPVGECELLARRLSRDEQLKARWGRYAVMGAVIRAERGVRLNAPLAGRVSAVLVAEPALAAQSASREMRRGGMRWWQPVAGAAVAASVAADVAALPFPCHAQQIVGVHRAEIAIHEVDDEIFHGGKA